MISTHIHWSTHPEIITIFGFPIRYYGLLFAGGIILSISVLKWIFKKENIPSEHLDKLTLYGIIGILAGARLGHCLLYEPSYYLPHPIEMILPISFSTSGELRFIGYQGLASHGGALGLIIALFMYAKKTGYSMINTIDLIAVVTCIAGGFIRLGNFFNSEIIGLPTTKPWGIVFDRVDNIPRHPAQLYEAFSYFIIFALMIFLYKKSRNKLKNGFFFGLAITLIFTARFLIEFVKENQVEFESEMALNMGQFLSMPYICVGISFMIYGLYKTNIS